MPHLTLHDDLSIYFQQQGEGRDVVFVHAFTSNIAIWVFTGIFDAFARNYRTTIYDLRGHGQSSIPPSTATPPIRWRPISHWYTRSSASARPC